MDYSFWQPAYRLYLMCTFIFTVIFFMANELCCCCCGQWKRFIWSTRRQSSAYVSSTAVPCRCLRRSRWNMNVLGHPTCLAVTLSSSPRRNSLRLLRYIVLWTYFRKRCKLWQLLLLNRGGQIQTETEADRAAVTDTAVTGVARWLSGRVSDLRSSSRGFEARPRRCCVTTLGKLFTPYCLCHQAV